MARQMKDSGYSWIGLIPEEWEVRSVKHFYSMQTGFTPDTKKEEYYDDENGYDWVTIGDLTGAKYIPKTTKSHISKEYIEIAKPAVVPKGSLLYSFKLSVGQVAFADRDVYTNEAIASFINNSSVCLDFLFYSSSMIIENANENIYGAKLLNQDLISNAKIVYPPIDEQRRIATFLDTQCAHIDTVIEKTKASIEEYKKLKQAVITQAVTKGVRGDRPMKDSGIEWIGEVPKEWVMQKMNRVCKTITDYVASGSFASLAENVVYLDEPDYAMLIRTMDVSQKGYEGKPVYINEHAYKFLENSNLYGGEIILPNIGASVGDVYIVPKLYERMSLAPNSIMIRTIISDRFVYYFFASNAGRQSVISIAQSTAQPKFNKTDFRQLRIPIPSDEEQKEIADYLDGVIPQLDELIQKKERTVSELETYKKSLIYEYVTGKKEVPDCY